MCWDEIHNLGNFSRVSHMVAGSWFQGFTACLLSRSTLIVSIVVTSQLCHCQLLPLLDERREGKGEEERWGEGGENRGKERGRENTVLHSSSCTSHFEYYFQSKEGRGPLHEYSF